MSGNRLLGHAALYTLSNFAVAGIPFFLLPILTRILDPGAYGIISMFTMVVAFLSAFVGLSMNGAIAVRYLDNSNFDIQTYVSTSLIILCFSSVLALIAISLFGHFLSQLTSVPIKWLYVAVIITSLQSLVQIMLSLWQASKKPFRYAALRISHALLDGVGSVILVAVLLMSWQGRITSMLTAWMLITVVAIYYLIREDWLAKKFCSRHGKDAIGYGIKLIPHVVGGVLLGMADRAMVALLLGVTSTGIYVVAVQLGLIIGILVESVNKAIMPWLLGSLDGITDVLSIRIVRYIYLYFFGVIGVAFTGLIIIEKLLPYLVGREFQSAGEILLFIFIGNVFKGMYYIVANFIFFRMKTGYLSLLTLVVGGVSILLSWYLITAFGIKGAAISFMVGQGLLLIGAWVLANKCVPMPWLSALSTRKSL